MNRNSADEGTMERMRAARLISTTAATATVALSLPLIAGFFGRVHPAFDSLAHFRVHLAILFIVCALPLLAGSFRRQGLAAIAFGIAVIATVSGTGVVSGLGRAQTDYQPGSAMSPVYRLLQMNLQFDNPDPERVLSLVRRLRPDVITFNEVSVMWGDKLAVLSSSYPYRNVCTMGDSAAGGVAILSLRPFAQGRSDRCVEGGAFTVATIDFGGRSLEIGALHLHWPWPFDQLRQIDELAEPLGAMAKTALLAGDLNATHWSEAAARVAASGALIYVGPGSPTWLYPMLPELMRFSGLPIDHIFAKGEVVVHSARTLDTAGSDHLPVLVEFSLAAPN